HIGSSLRSGIIRVSALKEPNDAGGPGSASRYGVLERGSSASADEGVEPARRDAEVRIGLAHVEEDLGACRAARLPAEQAAAEAEGGTGCGHHPPDPGRRSSSSQEATAYGAADMRAAAAGARLSRWRNGGQGCCPGLEANAARSLSAAVASAG